VFGVEIVTAQQGKRVRLASSQRPIAGRVCIGMLGAFLWDRGIPERIFVDWVILAGTGVGDTMPIRLLTKIFVKNSITC
jgi:hypothetical protein